MALHYDGQNKIMRERPGRYHEGVLNHMRQQRFNNRYSLTQRAKRYDALGDPHASYYFSNPSVKDHLKKFKRAIKEEEYNETERHRVNKLLTMRIKEKFRDVVCPKTLVYEKEMSNAQLDVLGRKSSGNLAKKKSRQSLATHTTDHDTSIHGLSARKKHYFKRIEPLNYTSQQLPTEEPLVNAQSQSLKANQDEPEQTNPAPNDDKKASHLKQRRKQNPSKTQLPDTEQSIYKESRMKTNKNDQKMFADKLAQQLHQKKHDKWVQFLQEKKKIFLKGKAVQNSPKATES